MNRIIYLHFKLHRMESGIGAIGAATGYIVFVPATHDSCHLPAETFEGQGDAYNKPLRNQEAMQRISVESLQCKFLPQVY